MAECVNYTVTAYEEKNGDILKEYKTVDGSLQRQNLLPQAMGWFSLLSIIQMERSPKWRHWGTHIIVTPEQIMKFTEFYIMDRKERRKTTHKCSSRK